MLRIVFQLYYFIKKDVYKRQAPGVVAVNAAIIIGYRLAGYTGAAVTLLATVLPPLITLTVISYFYDAFAHNYYCLLYTSRCV